MPIVLYVPPEGARSADRTRVREVAWTELRARELAEGDRLRPWFAEALRLLAGATWSVDIRFGIGRDAVRGLAAARDQQAVLAAVGGERPAVDHGRPRGCRPAGSGGPGPARRTCRVRLVTTRRNPLTGTGPRSRVPPEPPRAAVRQSRLQGC